MITYKSVRSPIAGCAALAALLVGGAALAADKEVRVYNWSDYIDEGDPTEFTEETGIKVVYDVFDSNEVLENKLLAGGNGYDVSSSTPNALPARSRPACSRSSTIRSFRTLSTQMARGIGAVVAGLRPRATSMRSTAW